MGLGLMYTKKKTSFTTSDNNKLQVLQNSLNELLRGADYNTPTTKLLDQTSSLSLHQMVAFQTIVKTYKIIRSNKPPYLANKIQRRSNQTNLRGRPGSFLQPKNLSQ
jgi:hypothetical protein